MDILGTEYLIFQDVAEEEMPDGSDGCFDCTTKHIKIAIIPETRNSFKDIEQYKKAVLRHEIIHAFLYESGLGNESHYCCNWSQNEEMVDWMAIQFPKIYKVFEKVGCL